MLATRSITMKHITVTLWNIQLYCDAIRKALEAMDPKGEVKIAVPAREGGIIESNDKIPVVPRYCLPPNGRRRKSR